MSSLYYPVAPTYKVSSLQLVQNSRYWAFLLLPNKIKYTNKGFKMCIWWQQTTWAILPTTYRVLRKSVKQNSGYLPFWLLAHQNRYTNEVLNMRIRWRQTTWVMISKLWVFTWQIVKNGPIFWEKFLILRTFFCQNHLKKWVGILRLKGTLTPFKPNLSTPSLW